MPEDGRNIAYRKGPAIIGTEDLAHEDASAFAKAGARAFFIGVVLVALQCWITPYIEQFINGTYLALDHLPKGPIIALFVLILTVNVLLLISRFGGAVKIGIFIGANAILIISYALSFAHQGKLPDEIGWWATHVLVYVGVNSLLLCVAWKGLPARAAGGLFFNASMIALIVLRLFMKIFGEDSAPVDLYDWVSLAFQLSMLAGVNLLVWSKPLDRAELLLVYCMLLVGAMLPNMGLYGYLVPVTSGHRYYETPESGWKAAFYDHVPEWVSPRDPVTVVMPGDKPPPRPIRWLYEGVPKGEVIPWGAWLKPLFCWSILGVFLYLAMFCISVILRKQWIDRERLPFPLAQVPLAMAEGAEPGKFLTPFFKSRLMWIGFMIPFLLHSFVSLHDIWPSFPVEGVRTHLRYGGWGGKTFDSDFLTDPPWSWLRPMWIMIYPSVIGLTYLLSLEVSFSLWFFYLIAKLQSVIAVSMGYGQSQWDHMGKEGFASFYPSQGVGAMFAMVIVGFYMARGQIADVCRRALGLASRDDVDDSNEPTSYRFAFFGLIVSMVGAVGWCVMAGMGVVFATASIVMFMLIVIGLTRIVAEGGLNYVQSWGSPLYLMKGAIGAKPLGSANLTLGTFVHGIFQFDLRCALMPSILHTFKIAGEGRVKRRYVGLAVFTAVIVTLILAPIAFLKISYDVGGARLNRWFYIQYPPSPFNSLTRDIKENRRETTGWALTAAEHAEAAVRAVREEGKPDAGVDVAAVEAGAKATRDAVAEYRAMLALRSAVADCDTALISYISRSLGIVGVQSVFDDLAKVSKESLSELVSRKAGESQDLDATGMSRKIEGLVAAAKAEEKDFDPQKAREGLGEIVDDLASYERVIGLSKVRRTTEELRTMSAPLWKVQKVQAPIWEWFKTDWTRYGWIAVGFVLMAVFMLLRLRIFWWPHPIGYVCYTNVHAMMKLWFSIFIGWLLKLCIIKYGGFRIYYKLRDLFIGLIVGEMMTGGIWILIKALAGVQGGWKIDIN